MAGALVHLAPVHLDGEIDGSSINAWKPGSTVCVLRWSVYDLLRGLLYDLDKAHGRLHDRIAGFRGALNDFATPGARSERMQFVPSLRFRFTCGNRVSVLPVAPVASDATIDLCGGF